jgi:hypothetical protein
MSSRGRYLRGLSVIGRDCEGWGSGVRWVAGGCSGAGEGLRTRRLGLVDAIHAVLRRAPWAASVRRGRQRAGERR